MFCSKCHSVLELMFSENSKIYFICVCGRRKAGNPKTDTLLFTKNYKTSEDTSKYATLIENASRDGINTLIKRTCGKCKLDYMAQVIIGDSGDVVYACKCGNYERI